jgi:hypothetical protein
MKMSRKCEKCHDILPPETEHFYDENNHVYYCTTCVKKVEVTSYVYYLNDDFLGTDEEINHVEDWEDDYDEC